MEFWLFSGRMLKTCGVEDADMSLSGARNECLRIFIPTLIIKNDLRGVITVIQQIGALALRTRIQG